MNCLEAFRAKIREQAPEAEQAAMTIAEQIRQEVSEQMRQEGRADMLTKLLVLKFKSLTTQHETRIAGATTEQLERYAERVLTAETIDDVFEP